MIQEINEYLQQANPDFNTGFGLFCKYSPNQSLMSWIGRKKDMEMLRYELDKLNRSGSTFINPNAPVHETLFNKSIPAKALPDAPAESVKIIFKTYDERRTKRSDLPEALQKVYDDIISEYPVRRGYHEKMKMAKTDADRALFRTKILEAEERIKAGWLKIDTYLENAEKEKVNAEFNEKSYRAYISKALKAEKNSDKVKSGVKIRLQALIDHGFNISEETQAALKAKELI